MKKLTVLFIMGVLVVGLSSLLQTFDLKASMERGKSIYEAQCVSCHMFEGEGIEGIFPPIAKSDYLANKDRLVQVILKGVRGKIKVSGKEYDGEMAAVSLTDEETSDLINYIRNSFGNKAPALLPKEIQPALKVKVPGYTPY
jgi:nitrite reductase (NO-forming)